MIPNQQDQSGGMNVEHLQNTAINGVEFVASVVSMPIEMMLRPWAGSRYFSVPVAFFSALLMTALPLFFLVMTSLVQMIPFAHVATPRGIFDFASFFQIYMLLCIFHGVRIARRMLKPELEPHSRFEGRHLPFFDLIPWCRSFWKTRVIVEPLFVLLVSIVLQDLFIVQSPLATYLKIAAFMLAVRQATSWYRSWEYVRQVLDMKNAGPALARLVDNTASEEDLAPMHLASFPKGIAADVRRDAAVHIARAYTGQS